MHDKGPSHTAGRTKNAPNDRQPTENYGKMLSNCQMKAQRVASHTEAIRAGTCTCCDLPDAGAQHDKHAKVKHLRCPYNLDECQMNPCYLVRSATI